MRNIAIGAGLAVAFMIGVLLFTPVGRKKKPVKIEPKERIETQIEYEDDENIFLSKKESPLVSGQKDEDKRPVFESQDGPRDTAEAHHMDPKYFMPFEHNEYDDMSKNLQEKLTSISTANAKRIRAKKAGSNETNR